MAKIDQKKAPSKNSEGFFEGIFPPGTAQSLGNLNYFSYFCINWKIMNLNAEVS